MLRRHSLAVACAALCLPFAAAFAQSAPADFPSRTIRIIVPFSAGGGTDVVVRILAKELEGELGQAVVIENKPGASTIIGAQTLLSSPADGYTWLSANIDTLASNPSLFQRLPYDVERDFAFTGLFVRWPMVLVSSTNFVPPTPDQLVPMIKQQAQKIAYSSYGQGTMPHLGMELMAKQIGVTLNHIPYKGSAPAVQAVMTKDVQLMMADIVTAQPQIRAGTIKAHAVTMAERTDLMPELPTMQELGVKGLDIYSWTGIVVPKAVPAAIQLRVTNAIERVAASERFKKRLAELGGEPQLGDAKEFQRLVQADTARLREVIRDNRISLD